MIPDFYKFRNQLTFLCCWSILELSNGIAHGECRHIFLEIERQPLRMIEQMPLPEKIPFNIRRRTGEKLFTLARNHWEAESFAQFQKILSDISGGGDIAKDLVWLKNFRKKSDILRRLFLSSGEKLAVPDYFDRFVQQFGKLNDAIEHRQTEEARRQAANLLSFDFSELSRRLDRFAAGGYRSTKAAYQDVIASIDKQVTKSELSISKFHAMRKDLKKFLSHFTLMCEFEKSAELDQVVKYLNALNDTLGAVNDVAVKYELENSATAASIFVGINKDLRRVTLNFLDRLDFQ